MEELPVDPQNVVLAFMDLTSQRRELPTLPGNDLWMYVGVNALFPADAVEADGGLNRDEITKNPDSWAKLIDGPAVDARHMDINAPLLAQWISTENLFQNFGQRLFAEYGPNNPMMYAAQWIHKGSCFCNVTFPTKPSLFHNRCDDLLTF